jgi:hypothetical protein
MARHALYALGLLVGSLAVGTAGFCWLAGQAPIDSFLNAAMLLGGMGPVGEIHSGPGKIFAAFFALYAGLAFLVIGTLVLAPVFHRFLHKFHLESERKAAGAKGD